MSQGGAVEYAAEERDARIRAEKRVAELERWQQVDLENYKRHLAGITDLIDVWRQRVQTCREAAGRQPHNEYSAMWNRQKAEILKECADELAEAVTAK